MSLRAATSTPPPGAGSGFRVDTDSEGDRAEEKGHRELILRRANALANDNRLKESVDCFSAAMRCGGLRHEQLDTLVDCILRNFRRNLRSGEDADQRQQRRPGDGGDGLMFDCPGCRGFLGEPVTVPCGHSYCRPCLGAELAGCRLCGEPVRGRGAAELKVNVVLCGLLEKWFPEELRRYKTVQGIQDLTRRKQYGEAVAMASQLIQTDAETAMAARLSRAEVYTALKQYRLALEDAELCLSSRHSAEGFFRKALVLHAMGQVDDSLQVFLHCLALNKDFPGAKRHVKMILCDMLSPAGESVREGLRETTQSSSPRLRSKILVADAQANTQPTEHQSHVQSQSQPQSRATSTDTHRDSQEALGRLESLERPGLSRAQSLRIHASGLRQEGLKRVCSAPQLGDQDNEGLRKRKLSAFEAEPHVPSTGGSKHKKHGGVSCSSDGHAASAKVCRDIPEDLLDPNDLECSLCMRLFYEPVTTPCGHTFCKNCLERCLDHTPQCPLCKESLKDYLASRKYTVTSILDELIKQCLNEDHVERTTAHLEENRELSDLTNNMPIFVCTMAYPTVPCPLHVFEPRYRLMIRRCMDTGTRQFGMCINDPQKGFADYGCMLIIRSVNFLPDGRSVVDTIGGKRFRVLSRGMKDGYSIADIEHLEDTRVDGAEELLELQELHDAVYEQARTWFQNLKIRFHNQILQHFGPMPEREDDIQATPNGPACCWWLLAVLPIDPRYQLSVLSMTSLRERLVKIQHILTYLQSIPGN